MALIHGKNAKIYWDAGAGNSNINLLHGQSWSVDATHDVEDITSMQDSWRTFVGGFRDWTATVECLLPAAGANIPLGGDDGMGDDECNLELYLVYDTGTPTYKGVYGSAICTGEAIGNDKDGAATVTYTFQGIAQLQWHSGAVVPTY